MTNKSLLFLVVVLLWNLPLLHAQYNRNENKVWIFGARSGIDFSGAKPLTFTSGIGTTNGGSSASQEGGATLADANGKFLFHTEGTKVWDATNNLMPNGANILGFNGTISTPTYSTTQSAVICPVPDSAGQYFIFSLTDANNQAANVGKLFCNKVKMDLNGGRGDIDTSFPLRHVTIDQSLTEKMTLVAGTCITWLLVYSKDTTRFKAYQVTNEGLDPNPVISYVGNFPKTGYAAGTLKASPNGKLLANVQFRSNAGLDAGLELYDFDYETGIVSNARKLDSMVAYYAADFSQDNSKLYATEVKAAGAQVNQFDLSNPNGDSIRKSKYPMGPCGLTTDIRLAPDGKLYFARNRVPNMYSHGNRALASIENPNARGALAAYKDTAILLDTLTGIMIGLPNIAIVQSRDTGVTTAVVLDSNLCSIAEPIILSVPPASSHIMWHDGSQSDSIAVEELGTYYVYYRNQKNCAFSDTFKISVMDLPEWYITIEEMILRSSHSFDAYQWYKNGEMITGATSAQLHVDENATYMLRVTSGFCEDTSSYVVTNFNSIETINVSSSPVRIYPNPAKDHLRIEAPFALSVSLLDLAGKELLHLEQAQQNIDLKGIKEGLYVLRVQNKEHNFFYGGTLLKKD